MELEPLQESGEQRGNRPSKMCLEEVFLAGEAHYLYFETAHVAY